MSAAARWRLAREPAVRIRGWDDETSALGFDERSGDTFVLGPLALELMAVLDEAGPLGADELLDRVLDGLPAPQPSLASAVAAELRHLQARGLVSPST